MPKKLDFYIIIPVRYQSSRLPGKALLDIAGKPMIQHVYERALASQACNVIIATDDERIARVVTEFGGEVCLTRSTHLSGTERIAEVIDIKQLPQDAIIVNVQGDEPLIPPQNISQVVANLEANASVAMATLCERITQQAAISDPNIVKVVVSQDNRALYFSRAPIPWPNKNENGSTVHYRHVGIYAYRAAFVQQYVNWGPCALEQAESLEQLRAQWHSAPIHVAIAQKTSPPGVDTQQDLAEVIAVLKGSSHCESER